MASDKLDSGNPSGGQTAEAIVWIPVFALKAILLVVPLWAEFGGLYHAYDGHGFGHAVVAFFIPPYAWYRSAEFFWHESPREERVETGKAWASLALVTYECNRATEFSNEQGPGFATRSGSQPIADAWSRALSVARTIDVGALDRADPGIGAEFELLLLRGLDLCVNYRDSVEFFQGQALLKEWEESFNSRRISALLRKKSWN